MNHGDLVRDILVQISATGLCRAWINNTGALRTDKRFIRFGLPGSSDIIWVLRNGKFLAIEIKIGRDRQSEAQLNFEKMILRFNGVYILARSPKDALDGIERAASS